jgi:Cu(I)/Ag(I) efflux system membrane fusion protein
MKPLLKGVLTVAAILAAAGAGLWAGQTGIVKLPGHVATLITEPANPASQGPVIYYRDPSGKPLYSLTPKTTSDGKAYVAVHASEDIGFGKPRTTDDAANATAEAEPQAASLPEQGRKIIHYRNPMGLPDISPVPKKDSMGMDYIPVYEDEVDDGDTVKISPGKIQRTGVKTEAVSKRQISRDIRAPGVVELDERRITVIALRFDGYIEKVADVTTGTHLKKGAPLMTIYAPELLSAGARLVIEEQTGWGPTAGKNRDFLKADNLRAPVIGARRRLENMGLPIEFIDNIARTREVPDTVVWRAPGDGIVLERRAVEGMRAAAGDVLFRIADHSVVWIMADVAEGDIGALKPGQSVKVTTRAHPGRVFNGKVAVIYPHLMKETRTARVRIELPNPNLALLPGMYADVDIATGSDEPVVAVPQSAVVDSGAQQVVLLDRGEGRFEPRDVKLGRKGDGYVEVLNGVNDGDRVVVDGNFLIDAESNLQSALRGLSAAPAKAASQ